MSPVLVSVFQKQLGTLLFYLVSGFENVTNEL